MKEEENKKDNTTTLIDFALKELQKTFQDLQTGKTPTVSKDLKKITDLLNIANKKLSKEEMDKIISDLAKKVEDKEKL
jgi:flagellin-specific chaperone FliS